MVQPSNRPPTTVLAAARAAAAAFSAAGIATARLDAEVLLRHVLDTDRTAYFLLRGDVFHPDQQRAYDGLIERRLAHESIAYIVGHREFMGRAFAVGPGVLVPRPETEVLVEWALDWLRSAPTGSRVLDVGTGSGAIALSLAAEAAARIGTIVASDVSASALGYAARNRGALALEGRVGLVRGDLAAWHGGPVDLLVANLPYLRPDQVAGKNDLVHEPTRALIGGNDGLALIRSLLRDAPRLLARGGAIGLEIDPSQADAVLAIGKVNVPSFEWRVIEDLAGLARHVVGESASAGRPRPPRS